jgi:hypothetical protein
MNTRDYKKIVKLSNTVELVGTYLTIERVSRDPQDPSSFGFHPPRAHQYMFDVPAFRGGKLHILGIAPGQAMHLLWKV